MTRLWTIGLGVVGGVLGAVVVWYFASKALDNALEAGGADLRGRLTEGGADMDAQLRRARADLSNEVKVQINELVPPEVERTIRRTLDSYNITPQTGARLDAALRVAEMYLTGAR